MATNDPTVNAALNQIALKMGITQDQALKLVVSKGAQQILQSTGAQAYAAGDGSVMPASAGGSGHLQAHEATHVLQQQVRGDR